MKHATIILKRKRDREISLEMLSEQELEQIAALTAYDEYALDEYVFSVLGNEIKITDEVIAAALNALPEDKRNIILLFYFLDMTDREIGKLLSLIVILNIILPAISLPNSGNMEKHPTHTQLSRCNFLWQIHMVQNGKCLSCLGVCMV